MNASIRLLAAATVVLAAAGGVNGAGWDRNGHSKITYEVATSEGFGFKLPVDVAKVLALGSLAPDYFEFSNPTAHSESPDPALDAAGRLVVASRDARLRLRDQAYRAGRDWHQFYLDAAVAAMNGGHRERAAFLLGYALHNQEDFATHRGISMLQEAGQKSQGRDVDEDRDNLAAARSLASVDLATFRARIGEDNWSLLCGRAVRQPGHVGSIVPEPLDLARLDLDGWDPASGRLPAPAPLAGAKRAADLRLDAVQAAVAGLVDLGIARTQVLAGLKDTRDKVENFAWGMLARQKDMHRLLEVGSSLGIARPAGKEYLAMPQTKGPGEVVEYLLEIARFEFDLPRDVDRAMLPEKFRADLDAFLESSLRRQYRELTDEERRIVGEFTWDECLASDLASLRARLAGATGALVGVKTLQLDQLREYRRWYSDSIAELASLRAAAQRRGRQRDQQQRTASAGPPTRDLRPREAPSASSIGASQTRQATRQQREPSGEGDSPSHRINLEPARRVVDRLQSPF